MRRLAVVASCFFAMVGGAAAKCPTLEGLELCGSAGCVAAASSGSTSPFLATVAAPSPPAAPQPYYELWSVYTGGGRRLSSFFVPGAAGNSASVARLHAVTGSIQAWQAPEVVTARTAGKPVQDPVSYVKLFTVGRLTSRWSGFGGWLRVDLTFDRPNPWTTTGLRISRKGGFVWRDGWVFRVPNALAARARHGLSLGG